MYIFKFFDSTALAVADRGLWDESADKMTAKWRSTLSPYPISFSELSDEEDTERLPFVWKNRLFQWENKWNGSFQRKFSGKKVMPSKVLLFSRFDRFNRNFLFHLFALLVPGSSARARNIASLSNGSVIHGLFVLFSIHLASRLPCTQL